MFDGVLQFMEMDTSLTISFYIQDIKLGHFDLREHFKGLGLSMQ